MTEIIDKVRNILIVSGDFEKVRYAGKGEIEVKDDIYYNIKVYGSLANLFG